ncbi:MAG TPA: hypothetical protein VFW45_15485 [Candidatus Polarisedimenticolia bacterium]|nr:hypothetical protein [Candidatus Polarisedimenticolia bacterium]
MNRPGSHDRRGRRVVAALAGLLLFSPPAVSRPQVGPEVLVEPRGLPLGAHVPAFHATDQSGRPSSFESLVGPRGLVLLFVRSADW